MVTALKKRVLIIDDSAVVRQVLSRILSKAPDLEVVGTAPDPFVAREKIISLNPDVLTLDVEMPRMDGLTFLSKLMAGRPMPVVMVSSLTQAGAETTLNALEIGAVDFVEKPNGAYGGGGLDQLEETLIEKVRSAASAKVFKPNSRSKKPPVRITALPKTTNTIVAIGSSTGGTEALRIVLSSLPAMAPGIIIVQHMPEHFTKTLAERLDGLCAINVREAAHGDTVMPGLALISPGGRHMTLRRSGARYYVELRDGPAVCNCRPSVDVLFRSVAKYAGKNTVGVILTGMGADGAKGISEMKESGAKTIAQDEESCVVFGMPKEAIKTGSIDSVVSLENIPAKIMKLVT